MSSKRKIYVASSWRNKDQPRIIRILRESGHEVYDFRLPHGKEDGGFHWSEIDPNWKQWTPAEFRTGLLHLTARKGFALDMEALEWANTVLLVLPCGRSAHLEAGWAVGAGKQVIVLLADGEPELMYRMFSLICLNVAEVLHAIKGLYHAP